MLAEALDERTPLLERAKFLAIFASNLDEFFMMRQLLLRHGATEARSNLLHQIREKLLPSLHRQAECYRQTIIPGLAEHGVLLRSWKELTRGQQEEAGKYFASELSPALTPWSSILCIPSRFCPISQPRFCFGCAMPTVTSCTPA